MLQQVLALAEAEAEIMPTNWFNVVCTSVVAKFIKPLSDVVASSGLVRRYDEPQKHSAAAPVAAGAVSGTSVSATAAANLPSAMPAVVLPYYTGPLPGLPPPALENRVSSSTL
jgi:hypothetical protein